MASISLSLLSPPSISLGRALTLRTRAPLNLRTSHNKALQIRSQSQSTTSPVTQARALGIPEISFESYQNLGAEDVEVSSNQLEGFIATTTIVDEPQQLKISVQVSGNKTQEIFDKVFDKMVADAQPIPGFRRVKGGKTPNIPKHILLEVLGRSRVLKQVIKRVINTAIAEHTKKKGLKVGKDLSVEQSFEDLELSFEAGEAFVFDAVVQLQDAK